MPFESVTQPVAGPESFIRPDDAAILSQAAILLGIGQQIRGDRSRLQREAAVFGRGELDTGADELRILQLPPLQPILGPTDSERTRALVSSRHKIATLSAAISPGESLQRPDVFQDLAARHFREGSAVSALELLEMSLQHPHELVRVAAAAAYHEHSSEKERLTRILAAGTRSSEELVRDVAATALAITAPAHPRLRELQAGGSGAAAAGAGDTTMLIHGTWAAAATWWQPGGDFHTYILQSVRSDLYSQPDRFGWSGGYSDDARSLGATDLVAWVNNRNEQGLDLITHSHGGNVAMLATTQGLTIGELILLSCPVHVPKYLPNFAQITKRIVSVRVHLDLVILADRGGQRFSIPQIAENVLPVWFDHSATHNPDVWKKYIVPAML